MANEDNSPLKQLFSIGKFSSKNEIKNKKFENDANVEVFHHQKKEKNSKSYCITIFGFQYVGPKKKKECLKICTTVVRITNLQV